MRIRHVIKVLTIVALAVSPMNPICPLSYHATGVAAQQAVSLHGIPSWYAVGADLYQEGSIDGDANDAVGIQMEPRWFGSYDVSVNQETYLHYLSNIASKLSEEEYQRLRAAPPPYYLPGVLKLPSDPLSISQNCDGTQLAFDIGSLGDPDVVELRLKLQNGNHPVWREVQHRFSNRFPFLFSFFIDGKALVSLQSRDFMRVGGLISSRVLLDKGGLRIWTVKIERTSLRSLLPNNEPHHLTIIAVFSERQHDPLELSREKYVSPPSLNNVILAPSGHSWKQVLVRSEPTELIFNGVTWVKR